MAQASLIPKRRKQDKKLKSSEILQMNIVVTLLAMIAERLMVLKVWRVVRRMIVRILVNVVVSGC